MTQEDTSPMLPENILTESDVIQFLNRHPDFFVNNPHILADLKLPHQSGSAVSLIEKQVSVLRDRNDDMQQRLDSLIENARRNDMLFEKTKRLILNLLEADDINDLVDALLYSFEQDFEIKHVSLLLFSEAIGEQALSPKNSTQVLPLSEANIVLGSIISNNKTICGQLDIEEQQFLFPEDASSIGSTAIAPLASAHPLGVLAIGNADPEYYRSSMSTLFLGYIADVLNRLLPHHLLHHHLDTP